MKEIRKTNGGYRVNPSFGGGLNVHQGEGNGVAGYDEQGKLKCEFATISLAKSYLGVSQNKVKRSMFAKALIETKLGSFRFELMTDERRKELERVSRARFY